MKVWILNVLFIKLRIFQTNIRQNQCWNLKRQSFIIWTRLPIILLPRKILSTIVGYRLDVLRQSRSANCCCFFLQPLSAAPRYILSPFFLSALLTMCNINRYPESTRLSSSHLLPLLRQVIQNNELEKEMCLQSAWCRQTVDHCIVSVEKISEVLIDQR